MTHTSLEFADFSTEDPRTVRALFYGLGSDGTVGANKNSNKIMGRQQAISREGTSCMTRGKRRGYRIASAIWHRARSIDLADHKSKLRGVSSVPVHGSHRCVRSSRTRRNIFVKCTLEPRGNLESHTATDAGNHHPQETAVLRHRWICGGVRGQPVVLDYESGTWEQLANSSQAIGMSENLLPDLLRSVEWVPRFSRVTRQCLSCNCWNR